MLRYLAARDRVRHPALFRTMFEDRARQFRDRLGWPVHVDADGLEQDEYDNASAVYVIWETSPGRHGGSIRFVPTTSPTMLADHFPQLTQNTRIASPYIWETTRLCLAPGSGARVSAALLLGGLEFGLHHNLSHAVGVFDMRMVRVYARLGWPPALLGSDGRGRNAISAGLWTFEDALRPALLRRAGVSSELSAHWLRRAGLQNAPADRAA